MMMKTFRDLIYALLGVCLCSTLLAMLLSLPTLAWIPLAVSNINEAVFSVSFVALFAAFVMYFHSKNTTITILKRRLGRVYGELYHHKMRLIDVMDGEYSFYDIENYLYNDETFIKIRKFLYEDYFLLLHYDPFFKNSKPSVEVGLFYSMHKELETFLNSITFDKIEYNKFKNQFLKVHGHPILPNSTEEEFRASELVEAYEALESSFEIAINTVDKYLLFIETHMKTLDQYFNAGVPWKVQKAGFEGEFQLWMHAKS